MVVAKKKKVVKKKASSKASVKVSPTKVKKGDLMAFTYWAEVDDVNLHRLECKLQLTNVDDDSQFQVVGNELIAEAMSADQFCDVQKVTKTKLVEIFLDSKNVPFTVKFKKSNGSPRILRGRLIGIDQKNLGYVDVEDLDNEPGDRFRLVDCRTIEYLIVGGIKYTH